MSVTVSDFELLLNIDFKNDSDKKVAEELKSRINKILNDKFSLGTTIDEKTLKDIKKQFAVVAKEVGRGFGVEIRDSISEEIRSFNFDKLGRNLSHSIKGAVRQSLTFDPSSQYKPLSPTGASSHTLVNITEGALDDVVGELEKLGASLKIINSFKDNFPKQMSTAHFEPIADEKGNINKYKVHSSLNIGDGRAVGISSTWNPEGKGRFSLESAKLTGGEYGATAYGKSALAEVQTLSKVLDSLNKKREHFNSLGKSTHKISKQIRETEEKIAAEKEKLTKGQSKTLENQQKIKTAKQAEKKAAQEVTEQQKQQNEAYKKAAQLLTEIHKYEKQTIINKDKTGGSELRRTNDEKIRGLKQEYSLLVKNLGQEKLQALEAKKKVNLAEKERLEQEKILKLRSSRNTRGSFLDELKTAAYRVTTYGVAYSAMNKFKELIGKFVNTVIEFDKHMTNLSIVTQGQSVDIKELTQSYIGLAKEVGATSEKVIEAADLWLRQGRSIAETQDLIKSTMYLSNIAMIDSAKSADILTSAINGFKLEAKDAMHVVDIFAAVDLAAAANTEELAEAMQRVAATAGEVGVSIENVTAYIGTLVDATRLDAGTIGSALNTILSRLQNIKLGSVVSDEGDNLSDAQKALRQVGIDLFDVNGSFKDMDAVLGELASKWSTLNDVERSSIAYAVAGTRQRNIFLQLMNNWNESLYLSAAALNSEGTALKKQEIYIESYEAKVNKLKSTWDEYITSIANSGWMKWIVDSGTGLLSFLDKANVGVGEIAASITSLALLWKKEKIGNLFGTITNLSVSGYNKVIHPIKTRQIDYLGTDDAIKAGYINSADYQAVEKQFIKKGLNRSGKTIEVTEKLFKQIGDFTEDSLKNEDRLDKAAKARLLRYKELNWTTDKMIEEEHNLAIVRKETTRASIQARKKEAWGKLSAGEKAKVIGSNAAQALGTGMAVYQVASAVGNFIASEHNKENLAFLDKAAQKISTITEKIQKEGHANTLENYELFEKITSQIGAEGVTPELQEELTTIINTLENKFGSLIDVENRIYKQDKDGNLTVKNLEELLADYTEAAADMTYESFTAGQSTAIQDLKKQANSKEYKAIGYGVDEAGMGFGIGSSTLAGAAMGAKIGSFAGRWGIAIGSLLGGFAGAVGGIFGKDYGQVEDYGPNITIAEAIKQTEANIKQLRVEGKTEEARLVEEELKKLQDIQTSIEESAKVIREDYNSAFQTYAKAVGKQKNLAASDIALIQSIVSAISKEISVEQLGTEETYNILQSGVNDLITYLSENNTNKGYQDLANKFAQGSYFAGLLDTNSSLMAQLTAVIQSNGVTLAKAGKSLKESIDKSTEEYKRQHSAAEKENQMLNTLATMGSELGMSGTDISEMLNLGGDVNVNKILNPAYRKYAKELADLYKEYWGEDGKIANASGLETQEQLNAEYERAISLKQKEYEILQKQLEVQKAQNKLSEVERERDTLVFRDGHFMYEANPAAIQQAKEEAEAAQREIDLLSVQQDIEAHTKSQLDYLGEISTALENIGALLEGDITANMIKIAEVLGEEIKKDLEDGVINNSAIAELYEKIKNMSPDEQAQLVKIFKDEKGNELFIDENGNFNKNIAVADSYDKGGLLQGKGMFSKQTSQDEVVLSATDAPQILSLLSRTGEFKETVNNADSLLRTLIFKEGKVSSALTSELGNSTIYNIENINVEEAEDIEGIIESASRIAKTTNSRFLRGTN